MNNSTTLPFHPFTSNLKDVLKRNHLKNVAIWLLGNNDNSILAQQSNSIWESSLSVLFFIEYSNILETDGDENQLIEQFRFKSNSVARWLLTKKNISQDTAYINWEGVTWDTSVVIRALIKVLKKYEHDFSESEREETKTSIFKGILWLYKRFRVWDSDVRYPFGPADVAQILTTLISVETNFPDLYNQFLTKIGNKKKGEIEIEILRYLLHIKTEKTLTIPITSDESEEVITYWWDDFFSTAEVVEAIALFYKYIENNTEIKNDNLDILRAARKALIRACIYFEQSQVDGMWGSHIDTIKVIYAYVRIRNILPKANDETDEPIIVPEIHTTFKALRWMCDEKQIFTDGSFLHTMFLTVFYAHALLEVYQSWQPATLPIEQLYDDVIWFSPVRTTPERAKRLAAELEILKLKENINKMDSNLIDMDNQKKLMKLKYLRFKRASITLSILFFFFIGLGTFLKAFNLNFSFSTDVNVLIAYFSFSIPIIITATTFAWNFDKIFK